MKGMKRTHRTKNPQEADLKASSGLRLHPTSTVPLGELKEGEKKSNTLMYPAREDS